MLERQGVLGRLPALPALPTWPTLKPCYRVASTPDGTMTFFGKDLQRIDGDRFVEYWAASSSGA